MGWDPKTLANDICILKVDRPMEYTDTIQPICISRKDVKELAPKMTLFSIPDLMNENLIE